MVLPVESVSLFPVFTADGSASGIIAVGGLVIPNPIASKTAVVSPTSPAGSAKLGEALVILFCGV